MWVDYFVLQMFHYENIREPLLFGLCVWWGWGGVGGDGHYGDISSSTFGVSMSLKIAANLLDVWKMFAIFNVLKCLARDVCYRKFPKFLYGMFAIGNFPKCGIYVIENVPNSFTCITPR